jgi:hypothetical protein
VTRYDVVDAGCVFAGLTRDDIVELYSDGDGCQLDVAAMDASLRFDGTYVQTLDGVTLTVTRV